MLGECQPVLPVRHVAAVVTLPVSHPPSLLVARDVPLQLLVITGKHLPVLQHALLSQSEVESQLECDKLIFILTSACVPVARSLLSHH